MVQKGWFLNTNGHKIVFMDNVFSGKDLLGIKVSVAYMY